MPAKPGSFKPGDPRINRKGRPPTGASFADAVREVVGIDGRRLVQLWAAVGFGWLPPDDRTSSRALVIATLKDAQHSASMTDRIACTRLLAERGFGKPKEETSVSGSMVLTWET